MYKLKIGIAAIAAVAGMTAAILNTQHVSAAPADQVQGGVNAIGGAETGKNGSLLSSVQKAVNVLLFLTGALAVLMIVYGGFKYVTSRGESSEVTSAKNTILYAVVGLVVAILAYAIVRFVVGSFTPAKTNTVSAPTRGGPTAS